MPAETNIVRNGTRIGADQRSRSTLFGNFGSSLNYEGQKTFPLPSEGDQISIVRLIQLALAVDAPRACAAGNEFFINGKKNALMNRPSGGSGSR